MSQTLIQGHRGAAPLGRRLPAGEIEGLVAERLASFLQSTAEVHAAIEPEGLEGTESSSLIARAAELARTGAELPPAEQRRILLAVLDRVAIHRE